LSFWGMCALFGPVPQADSPENMTSKTELV
jgi:hypothetical protein